MPKFSWNIDLSSKKSYARIGRITTPHGIIETPAFIFDKTKLNFSKCIEAARIGPITEELS